jgi:hypothetical protein
LRWGIILFRTEFWKGGRANTCSNNFFGASIEEAENVGIKKYNGLCRIKVEQKSLPGKSFQITKLFASVPPLLTATLLSMKLF